MQEYFVEVHQLLALAIPVIFTRVAQTAMGFVGIVMAGGYSTTDMATAVTGTSIWLPAILSGHRLLLVLTPVVVQLSGSGRRGRITQQMRQGLWLADFISVLIMVVLWNAGYIISPMHNIDLLLTEKAIGYLCALLWDAPGYLFFQTARNQREGLVKAKPRTVVGFIGLLANILVNYILIYGHFGMLELDGVGCGVVTISVYWMMFASMLWWVCRGRLIRNICCAERFSHPDVAVLLRPAQLGLSITLALFLEVTLLAAVALLVSPLGIIDVVGHQIALNFSSLMFILPLSLAAAVIAYAGFRLGQGSTIDTQASTRTGVGVDVCLAVFTAIFITSMREQIVLLYNDNPKVVLPASHLMLLAVIYRISDPIQVIDSGILRGYKDTRSTFFITFTAYQVLGSPSGYLLVLTDMVVPRMGSAGFWCRFVIDLTPAAVMMVLRVRFLQRQPFSIILQCTTRQSLQSPPLRWAFSFSGIVTTLYTPLLPDTKDLLMALPETYIV